MADLAFDRALRISRLVYAIAQLLPGFLLTGIVLFGYLTVVIDEQPGTGLVMFFLPVVLLIASAWQLQRSWSRPAGWTIGTATAGSVLGLAAGAITAILLAGAGLPKPVTMLGFVLAIAGGSAIAWWPAWLVQRRLLRAEPATLARSSLVIPFWLRGYSGITLEVGHTTVELTGRYHGYRNSVLSRVSRRTRPLTEISAGAGTLTERQDAYCPVAQFSGMIRASPGPVLYLADGSGDQSWVLPMDNAGAAADVIRLRKHSGAQSQPRRRGRIDRRRSSR